MLSGLFGIPAIDPAQAAEEKRLQALAAMNPFEADAYTTYSGAAQAGQGLGKIAAGLTGRDVRAPAQKRTDAIEAAKAQVAKLGFDLEDPKSIDGFYKQVIQILQKQGLAGEALDVAREWGEHKKDTDAASLGKDKLAESVAKREAKKIADAERNTILKAKNAPELARMIDVVESFDPITQGPQRKMRMDALNAMMENKRKGIVLEDAGDRIIVRDRSSGAQVGTPDEKGAAPLSEKDAAKEGDKAKNLGNAYRNAVSKAQADYDVAVRLYNHPGVQGITGRLGRLVGEPGVAGQTATTTASGESRGALALWKQVTGGTFLAGLNDLKAASPTGSTGLGQTSNIEGEKVQNAKAALSREQDAADFRLNLKVYLRSLEEAAKNLGAAAQTHEIAPVALVARPLTGPTDASPRPAAASGWGIRKK
jgi:hypothetical protein